SRRRRRSTWGRYYTSRRLGFNDHRGEALRMRPDAGRAALNRLEGVEQGCELVVAEVAQHFRVDLAHLLHRRSQELLARAGEVMADLAPVAGPPFDEAALLHLDHLL